MEKREKKALPVLERLEVIDAGTEGQGVAKHNDIAVFIKDAVPGDVVDVQVTRKKSNYREGRVVKVHKYSEKRAEPACSHFGVCGGCKWQNMDYKAQLFYKEKQVVNALRRIGKLEIPEPLPIIGSKDVYHYRNKLEFTFSNKRWLTEAEVKDKSQSFDNRNALGFHIPGLFDKVLDITECHLQPDPSNAIRNEAKRFAVALQMPFFDLRDQHGLLRNMVIRTSTTGEVMVIVIFFEDRKTEREALLDHLAATFPQITSLHYVINQKKNDNFSDQEVIPYKGNEVIFEQMEDLRFRISPKSFYQTNPHQAYELYKAARTFAGLKGSEVVYDLYTGTGTIANFVARQAGKVIGVEYVPAAIEDAKINSKLNNITNTAFFAGDMKQVLNEAFIAEHGKADVVITDPPRAGMPGDVVHMIASMEPHTIVYVSCNPSTQARDLAWISDKYRITAVQPVDMFPHTTHVENVVKLERTNYI